MPATTSSAERDRLDRQDAPLIDILSRQRAAFRAHSYPSPAERREHLTALLEAVLARRDALADAIGADFGGRSKHEVMFSEIYVSVRSIRHARRHLKHWMARRKRPVDWPMQIARAFILPQPLGVVGIIVPWNYPVFLAIGPLVAALAAGNRVMLKLSEHTPRTSALMAEMIAATFTPDHVTVIQGDSGVGRAFAALPFDHLLFTGSTAVGREVMRAASGNLTPVTLELGGKSPAIIATDADLDRAASDIVYGKLLNAGQTCIAPDYVLVPADLLRPLVECIRQAIAKHYPDPASEEFTSIINDNQYQRLMSYLDEAHGRGVEIIPFGSATTATSRKIPPVLAVDPPESSSLMRDEIFGPILPLKPYTSIENAIAYINDRPRPLALYLFTKDKGLIDTILTRTTSGGVCVNDTLLHVATEDLPFGGVGASGMGRYHAQEGFDTFSQLKPVFERGWFGLGKTLRPPYTRIHEWMERILIR
jgi:aldehyde dehydrogenase (NAD+)/coniferyl-aldehyde dehydrogenase